MEDQMVTFVPEGSDSSPDRVDALVWALSELTEKRGQTKLKVIR
jgi:phage terminase large subunit-like protein